MGRPRKFRLFQYAGHDDDGNLTVFITNKVMGGNNDPTAFMAFDGMNSVDVRPERQCRSVKRTPLPDDIAQSLQKYFK